MNVTKVRIEFDTVNAAFTEGKDLETARILRELADKVESRGLQAVVVRDYNGNRVGTLNCYIGD